MLSKTKLAEKIFHLVQIDFGFLGIPCLFVPNLYMVADACNHSVFINFGICPI